MTGNSSLTILMSDRHWSSPCPALMELSFVCESFSVLSAARPHCPKLLLNWSLSSPARPSLPVYIMERERKTDMDGGCQAVLAACWAALCCCCLLDSLD